MSAPNLFASDIPAGWLVIITGIGGAISLFLRTLWNGKNKEIEDRDKVIAARDAVILGLRDKIDKMQEESLQALRVQLEQTQKRLETDDRVARSQEGANRLLETIVAKVTP